jgi:hypothetical protein
MVDTATLPVAGRSVRAMARWGTFWERPVGMGPDLRTHPTDDGAKRRIRQSTGRQLSFLFYTGGRAVRGSTELRAQAESKRRVAELVRRTGATLSTAADRKVILQHAQELEAEATGLEAQAHALDAQRKQDKSD